MELVYAQNTRVSNSERIFEKNGTRLTFGTHLGRFGMNLEFIWDAFGICVRVIWDCLGIIWNARLWLILDDSEFIWDTFGTRLGFVSMCGSHLGRVWFGTNSELLTVYQCCNSFGTHLGHEIHSENYLDGVRLVCSVERNNVWKSVESETMTFELRK